MVIEKKNYLTRSTWIWLDLFDKLH